MTERVRLDRLLVRRGLAPTRTRAQALLLAGRVTSGGRRLDKAGQQVDPDLPLEVAEGRRWVGRGAHKLLGAVERFAVDPRGRDALDVGSSTGGFTQVLLEAGARRVAAIDVGRGQLDWSLRQDERVVVMEGVNVRLLRPDDVPFRATLATFDVSFISLRLVVPPVVAALAPDWEAIALVKPQFEVGRGRVGRKGLVRDPELHVEVLLAMSDHLAAQGWAPRAAAPSPLPGAEGNREFFLHFGARLDPRPPVERTELERVARSAIEEPGS